MKYRYNLGCGKKKVPYWINFDRDRLDLNKFPYDIPENSADEVLLDNVLEHLDNPLRVLEELHRICKDKALITLVLPFGVRGLCNPTHKTFWNNYSLHFIEDPKRDYYLNVKFNMIRKFTIPFWWAKPIPTFLRDKLAIFTNFLINKEIVFELEVIKEKIEND